MADLRVLALVKQVPKLEQMTLNGEGLIRREGLPLEMSAYCRRAVAKAVELAREHGGRCTVASLGASSAEEVLRESLAWGADDAVLMSESDFAGSDSLVTAKSLAALVEVEGPFDLILTGLSSFDSGTGQVGPQLAELLGLPFAAAVREMELDCENSTVRVKCERDDGWRISKLKMPAVLGVAERLCSPAKLSKEAWGKIPTSRVRTLTRADLGSRVPQTFGSGSIRVKPVGTLKMSRTPFFFEGALEEQVAAAVEFIQQRDSNLDGSSRPSFDAEPERVGSAGPVTAVILERDREGICRDLLWHAHRFAQRLGGSTVAISPGKEDPKELWRWGADELMRVEGAEVEEDFARAVISWVQARKPAIVLAPATHWGREITSRLSASQGVGSISEASHLELDQGRLIAWKTASGPGVRVAMMSDCELQVATMVPTSRSCLGMRSGEGSAVESLLAAESMGRVHILSDWRNDDWESLARAEVVLGVGAGVKEDEFDHIYRLAAAIGAEVAGTRKITDLGLLPRSRQIGITGRSISPRLYVAIGLSGKANHMVGVRGAETIVAINSNRDAPVFGCCDFGVVGDWRKAVSLILEKLSTEPAVLGEKIEFRRSL